MSQKDLAKAINVYPSAISQFESQDAAPSPETLARLTEVLCVSAEYFSAGRPPKVDAEACYFRKQRSTTQREVRRILARGTMLVELFDRVEQFVNFPEPDLPVRDEAITDVEELEHAAEGLRHQWGLGQGPIGHLLWLVEHRGAIILEMDSHSDTIDAFSTRVGIRPLIFLASGKESSTRRRFDVAHELGHLLLHPEACAGDKVLEAQADRFASAFLLPRKPFLAECPQRLVWPHLLEMKKRWKVSLQVLVRRAYDLGVFSEATYRRAYHQLNERGWRTREPEEPPLERPALLPEAVQVVESMGYSIDDLRTGPLGISPFELRQLILMAS